MLCFVYMIDWYGNVGKSWEMSRSIKCTNKENTLRGIGRKRKLVGNVFFLFCFAVTGRHASFTSTTRVDLKVCYHVRRDSHSREISDNKQF